MKKNCLFPILIAAFLFVTSAKAQTFFTGSIKRNLIERTKLNMSAIPDNAPGFTVDAITPTVKNSISYSIGVEKFLSVGKSFHINSELSLDMMQLNIVSGIKKTYSSNGFTYYSSSETNQLIPRVRAGFGIDLFDLNINNLKLKTGVNAAQIISLNSDMPSYSVVGASIRVDTKNISFFIKGSMMPYNIQFKNLENYVGDLNAKVFHFESAYRIKELQVGFSVPFSIKSK